MNCPQCGKAIPAELLLSEAGRQLVKARKNLRGGWPKGKLRKPDAPRCECGRMTLARAGKRGHKCEEKRDVGL